jgi:hypothetical protein
MTVITPDLDLAPGCFGLAMTYKEGTRECSACPFASACEPLALENLAIIRAELGVVVPPPKPVAKVALVERVARRTAEQLVTEVPKKVQAHLDRFERLGIKFTPALARGENPVAQGQSAFMRIACHLLLKAKEGFSRDMLVQAFVMSLKHTNDTAQAHAKQAVQILEAVGAAKELNGKITLTKAVTQ